uniref:Uncharacterized protein n=1 Tax=Physcomitrium patens TaxID=3218 RepID=A0A2K1K4G4_PHYPA|nr:hypothetical protein PHYPA_013141 [Physcomitrium patens]
MSAIMRYSLDNSNRIRLSLSLLVTPLTTIPCSPPMPSLLDGFQLALIAESCLFVIQQSIIKLILENRELLFINSHHTKGLSAIMDVPMEPSTFKQALNSPETFQWKYVILKELNSNAVNGTWVFTELAPSQRPIKCQ